MYSTVDLCLLCLTYNKNRKSILSQDDDGVDFEDKCRFILNENVDIRPEVSYICLQCLRNLNNVYKFKKMCLKNIKTFNNYVDTLESKKQLKVTKTDLQYQKKIELMCSNESENEISPPIEVVLIKEEIADNCVLQDGHVLENKAKKKNDEFSTPEKSENDNMKYSSSLNEEHCIVENYLNRVKKETGLNLNPEEIQIKDECLFEATDSDSEHKTNNKLQNEGTNKPDSLNDKLDSEHSTADDDKRSSKNCNSSFSEEGKNRGLDQNVDSVKQFKCDKCHKAFLYPSFLKIHSRVHTGERPFKCTTCKKTFSSLYHLNRHIRIHTGEKPYECDVCCKTFTVESNLIVHKRVHTNERPFKCSVCHNAFAKSSDLSRHMRKHTGEKPYQCQVCQYKFTTSGNLKKHMQLHTGGKPFTCKHCQKSFRVSSSLKRHMQTHL